jgi:hypothetical protein
VYDKSLEMRHFRVFPYPEEVELAPSWAAGVARDERNERNGSNGGGRVYNPYWLRSHSGNAGQNDPG